MSEPNSSREKELVLAPNEYAYVLDKTKGQIQVYVGPHKVSLSATDSPVIFNERGKKFQECLLDQAIAIFPVAPEGWYVVLKNPAKENKHPSPRASNDLTELKTGTKVNIPGPVSFPLWPGQMSRIIEGHRLRSNQYLVVRIYDAEAVVESPITMSQLGIESPGEAVNGNLYIIKGTDKSFYIPPTGVEVVPDDNRNYIRDAVTLETLEYCILLDENGSKSFIKGPEVVFPYPTQKFMQDDNGYRKFKAIELSDTTGIYVKVIAAYSEGDPPAEGMSDTRKSYNVGDELFITGQDQMIYFPRPEHATIRYGDDIIHYAVAIPEGEARYVLHRRNGNVRLQKGPCMFLPDPRDEVIVRRVLESNQSELWFPGNAESKLHNANLANLSGNIGYVTEDSLLNSRTMNLSANYASASATASVRSAAKEAMMPDGFDRGNSFTPPRTITLNTKYDGAVTINVWTGYAIQVVNKSGQRKVITGPTTYLLEYDEYLESIELSAGTPKGSAKPLKTSYLRVVNNKVSDIIQAETKDYCNVQIAVSYSLNFEGDPNKWFADGDYVKLLCDRTRSLLRRTVKQHFIEEFYANSTDIVRSIIATEGSRKFEENGMVVFDIDVLDVIIMDSSINEYLVKSQRQAISDSLALANMRRQLDNTKERETINQEIASLQTQTYLQEQALVLEKSEAANKVEMDKLARNQELQAKSLEIQAEKETKLNEITLTTIERNELQRKSAVELSTADWELEKQKLEAALQAEIARNQAITPELVTALQTVGDKYLLERMCKDMAPLAILGGDSVGDVLANLLKGTGLETMLTGAGIARVAAKLAQ